MFAAKPLMIACVERDMLLFEYARAAAELNRMHSAEFAAILRGEELNFSTEIAEAERIRENAKYAILAHRQEHGC